MITQLKVEHQQEIEKLNGKVEEKDALLKSEKAKLRTARIELDEVADNVSNLKKKAADATKALNSEKSKTSKLERDLASAKSRTMAAQDQLVEVENSYAELQQVYKDLKRRFDQFEKNIRALNEPVPELAPVAEIEAAAPVATPQSDLDAAMDILNEMSTK
jgi:chromosome segregation ATPase